MSNGVSEDVLRSSIYDLLDRLVAGEIQRPRVEEELVFLAEQHEAYILIHEDEVTGFLSVGMLRESYNPRAVIAKIDWKHRCLKDKVVLGQG